MLKSCKLTVPSDGTGKHIHQIEKLHTQHSRDPVILTGNNSHYAQFHPLTEMLLSNQPKTMDVKMLNDGCQCPDFHTDLLLIFITVCYHFSSTQINCIKQFH